MGIPATHNVDFDAAVAGVQASWSVLDQKLGQLRRGNRQAMDFLPEARKRIKTEKPGDRE